MEYYYSFASQRISRPPIRCVVIGESNSTVEAAHELGMKAVVVTGNRPVYDFSGADLVVRDLSQLSLINLKRLFANEDLVASKLVRGGGGPLARAVKRGRVRGRVLHGWGCLMGRRSPVHGC